MKIALIRAYAQSFDLGAAKAAEAVAAVLTELGVETVEIDTELPFFEGAPNAEAERLFGIVRESSAIVLATAAVLPAPNALAARFLEYLSLPCYGAAFAGKNCMLVVAAESGAEREAMDVLARVLRDAGAFDSVRVAINTADAEKLTDDVETKEIIEKQAEDFYRFARQGRKFYAPKPTPKTGDETHELPIPKVAPVPKPKANVADIYKKLNIREDDADREAAINEIARYLTQRGNGEGDSSGISPTALKDAEPVAHRAKTVKQLTKNLTHYYKPQSARELNAVFALNITGAEVFEGWLEIKDGSCAYHDGAAKEPDITILAEADAWSDVLKGKHSAQKAFMTGRLKVRGNFVLLPKFDLVFARNQSV